MSDSVEAAMAKDVQREFNAMSDVIKQQHIEIIQLKHIIDQLTRRIHNGQGN